jgi:alkaline phosphatase D
MKTKAPLTNFFTAPTQHEPARRQFVRSITVGALAVSAAGLTGCGSDSDAIPVSFLHGVASGDPLSDRVILWTRLTVASTTAEIPVEWELSGEATFDSIVAKGVAATGSDRDFTVKVDATGLTPGTQYFYRFRAYSDLSPVGKTRTLPGAGVAQVKLAVFSCSNYPAGYFNAYAEAAKRSDFDAALHLGDYIDEYAATGYASANAAALGRVSLPATEIISLADYRVRYAQYRTDPDLQALHAAAPMIAVWDDHEIANDTYITGAENHQPATEGDFAVRKAAALQAYHEWMPTRVAQADTIYRSFDFGNLLSLHMLDTRIVGREKQLDYANFFKTTGFDGSGFTAAVGSPTRQLLGSAQVSWLQQKMTTSTATWQVLG